MKQVRQSLLLLVLTLLAVLVGGAMMIGDILLTAPPEPAFDGKTLSQWIVQLDQAASLHPADFNKVAAAQFAIRAIGTNALPFALANLHVRLSLGDRATGWLAKHAPFLKLRPKNVAEKWALGVQILDILGPIAEPCLPELIAEATNNPGYSEEAMLAVGGAAVPAFTNLVRTTQFPETGILIRAFEATMRHGQLKSKQAAAALPTLTELLKSKDRDAARKAAEALNSI